jgi:DNA-binding transcriptional ArsR family regulator
MTRLIIAREKILPVLTACPDPSTADRERRRPCDRDDSEECWLGPSQLRVNVKLSATLSGKAEYILFRAYSLTRIYMLRHIACMMETLKALAEPNRLQIVELLLDGPRPVGELVDELGLRQPQVSKHLRVLSEAGLVGVRVDAQRRIYALQPAPLKELGTWVAKYRRVWEENFQRMDGLPEEMKRKERKHGRKKR